MLLCLQEKRVNKVKKCFYGDGKDVVVISNHLNAGGGNNHCVTKVCITIKSQKT
ncbi:MAG: hypothetical protein L6V81_09070 [Clostridium sp.]|nr:MAG: hypothetical protein L6V81_09070 [Clostridium sp.]